MPTLADVRRAHPDDANALGDWTSTKHSQMRLRYADSTEDSAAVAKLTHVLLIQEASKSESPLSWKTCRVILHNMNIDAIEMLAIELYAEDLVVAETDPKL
eukprot:13673391-Heterocapsa_arctica.AAC.1